MPIQVEVWGDYACFARCELKTERVSYDVMTPSAARGLLESIYWHPGLRWVIDRIHVCAPIRFTNIRRNEVKDVISARRAKTVMEKGQGELYLAASESIQQRAAMVLRDVHYVIDAHFDMTDAAAPGDNPGKFQDIIKRRLEKGQCYSMPYFGTREFPAQFRRCTESPPCPDELKGREGLWQPYPVEYKRGKPKEGTEDTLQLCGQAMCLEEMLCCEIPRGALYYGEPRRRTEVDFTPELRQEVRALLEEMHALYARGSTPKVKPTKGCNACSLKGLCLPKLMRSKSVSAYLRGAMEGER